MGYLLKPRDSWEYRIVEFSAAGGASRTGTAALAATTIQIDQMKLREIGAEGWELVSTMLEVETAFPNFGKDEYVTGLRENVRPQKAVLVFKRKR